MLIDYCFWCGKEITEVPEGLVDADGQFACAEVLNWDKPHETTNQAVDKLLAQ